MFEDFAQFQIREAPASVQQKIRSKIETSHHKQEQSKQLLKIAKTEVERAILLRRGYANETDKATTTTWINEQLETLGVKIS
jgi:hypothetical protein